MNHSVFGRKLSRTSNERRRLFMELVREMIEHGSVQTTLAKAKAVQPLVEKMVTRAKDGTEHSRRQALKVIDDRKLTAQLFADAKTQFANRQSGFTRIIKLGMRRGDATEEAVLSFVDQKVVVEVVKPKKAVAKTEATVVEPKAPAAKPAAKKAVKTAAKK